MAERQWLQLLTFYSCIKMIVVIHKAGLRVLNRHNAVIPGHAITPETGQRSRLILLLFP